MTEQEYLTKNQKSVQKKAQPDPTPAGPVNIQRMGAGDLQRLVGNKQAQRMLAQRQPERAKPSLFIQTKLTVGAADDSYEREADSVASQVMTAPANPVQRADEDTGAAMRIQRAAQPEEELMAKRMLMADRVAQREEAAEEEMEEGGAMRIQREEAAEEEMEEGGAMRIQREEAAEEEMEEGGAMRIQREEAAEEEMEEGGAMRIQREEAAEEEMEEGGAMRIQRQAGGVDMMGSFDVGEDVEKTIDSSRGGGQPLPDESRGFFEDRMGYDFSNVNVHTDAGAQNVNRSIQAQAFTTGSDIYFNSDKYNPGSDDGKKLLAHELTHVVQQGGAAPKVQPDREDKK